MSRWKNSRLEVEHGESDAHAGLGFALALTALIVFVGLTVAFGLGWVPW